MVAEKGVKMLNVTQKQWIKERLEQKGEISRNDCLKHYISRLGAIMGQLKDEGYVFIGEYRKVATPYGWTGRDYVYKLLRKTEHKSVL